MVTGDTHSVTTEEVTDEVAEAIEVEEAPVESDAAEKESVRRLDFYAAPYMLKLRFNEDLIPANMTKETAGKDFIW